MSDHASPCNCAMCRLWRQGGALESVEDADAKAVEEARWCFRHRVLAVPGLRVCAPCRARLDEARRKSVAKISVPSTESDRYCTGCKAMRPIDAFSPKFPSKDPQKLRANCKSCRVRQQNKRYHQRGGLPMRLRPAERNGEAHCCHCGEWQAVSEFYVDKRDGRRASWCRTCKMVQFRLVRRNGSVCECGTQIVGGECPVCVGLDGRGAEDGAVISALRVLGGEAQLMAIVEDIGGDLNEDIQTGPGVRRAYRGLAALRVRGVIATDYDGVEAASLATHRLKRGSR